MERFCEANFGRISNKSGFLMVRSMPDHPITSSHQHVCLEGLAQPKHTVRQLAFLPGVRSHTNYDSPLVTIS